MPESNPKPQLDRKHRVTPACDTIEHSTQQKGCHESAHDAGPTYRTALDGPCPAHHRIPASDGRAVLRRCRHLRTTVFAPGAITVDLSGSGRHRRPGSIAHLGEIGRASCRAGAEESAGCGAWRSMRDGKRVVGG